MSVIIKKLNNSQLLICIDNGETAVVFQDSSEAKFWLQKEKDKECEK